MKKELRTAILSFVLLAGQFNTFGQDKPLTFYYPDGTKYKGTAKNIAQINKELEEQGRVYVDIQSSSTDNFTTVGYKLFTNKPLWILTDNPDKVNDAITRFDLNDLMTSWKFESELEKYIKKGVLTDIFILETLGPPTNQAKYFDSNIAVENWTYDNLSLTLTLKKGIVTSYVKQD
jgi:hypothetical protein